VHAVDVVAVQAVPDVLPRQSGHRPVVPLADHLLSHVIFPFRPVHLGIGRDVFVEDDDREIQAAVHFESAFTLGLARRSPVKAQTAVRQRWQHDTLFL